MSPPCIFFLPTPLNLRNPRNTGNQRNFTNSTSPNNLRIQNWSNDPKENYELYVKSFHFDPYCVV